MRRYPRSFFPAFAHFQRRRLMKTWFFIGLVLLFATVAGAFITESEPNNTPEQADVLQCGDTVSCAVLSPANDLDHFRFSTLNGDSIIITTWPCLGSATNTLIVLFDDGDSVLAVNDNGGPGEFSLIRYRAFYSGDYVVRVLRQGDSDSTYTMTIDCPVGQTEDYDYCSTARIIPSFPYHDQGTTRGMSNDCNGTDAPDVFYAFHNPILSHIFITVCSSPFDARVQIMSRCCGGFGDDASIGCLQGANLTCLNLPEGDYIIMVEGTTAQQAGDFSIDVNAILPGCPVPGPVVLTTVGGLPFLDWPQIDGPSYFIVWQSNSVDGPWEHLDFSFATYYWDSTGYAGMRRFYRVTSVCPW